MRLDKDQSFGESVGEVGEKAKVKDKKGRDECLVNDSTFFLKTDTHNGSGMSHEELTEEVQVMVLSTKKRELKRLKLETEEGYEEEEGKEEEEEEGKEG
ncbi:uncharacterized protein MONOS_17121 [Monocercomonoides exilis]|uniref:uncharacterized protein n=1 Tax=Monocercomonoides exilis TaxID=2049356 RepID=UPI0035597199|nr:hypothetical protein MONOS_17121 [Monocercomonoides exilis]